MVLVEVSLFGCEVQQTATTTTKKWMNNAIAHPKGSVLVCLAEGLTRGDKIHVRTTIVVETEKLPKAVNRQAHAAYRQNSVLRFLYSRQLITLIPRRCLFHL